jgi:rhodanese-related sulfurtransferase
MLQDVTANEVLEKLDAKQEVHLIDVREDEEVAMGMIPGAIHIPLHTLPERLDELDQNKEYIMVCRSGGRSAKAQELLNANGFKTVNMVDGMLAWKGKVE